MKEKEKRAWLYQANLGHKNQHFLKYLENASLDFL